MNFPVLIKTAACVEPATGTYYAVAENGVFQVRDTTIYRAVTRAEGPIPGLLPEREQLRLKCPRLPRRQVEDVLAFFAEVYRRYAGEAVVILFYRVATRDFHVAVPPQVLLGRRRHDGRWRADHAVQYGSVVRPEGFVRFGTIHSHADLPAYASGIDCDDEQYEDGLHVVFGDFGFRELSIAASFVANRVRFRLVPADVLEPCVVPKRPARADWLACVRREEDPQKGTAVASPVDEPEIRRSADAQDKEQAPAERQR